LYSSQLVVFAASLYRRPRRHAIRNPVDASILAICRDKSEAELLAYDTREEAAD
jgi:hypothetical protein